MPTNVLDFIFQTNDTLRKSHLMYRNPATVSQFHTSPSNSPSLFNGLRFTHVPIESISLNGVTPGFKTTEDSVPLSSHRSQSESGLQPAERELLKNLAEMLSRIDERSRNKEMSKLITKEWGDLAIILDRIFFIICFTGFVVTSVILLTPHSLHL